MGRDAKRSGEWDKGRAAEAGKGVARGCAYFDDARDFARQLRLFDFLACSDPPKDVNMVA